MPPNATGDTMTQRVKNKIKCRKLHVYHDGMLGVVVVLSGVLALAAASSVNYCGARMCGNTDEHTFCQYPKGPSAKCVAYKDARLRTHEKTRIVARLNSRRNEAASGALLGFPPAGNMLKMVWVEELAREAQRWADQCLPPRPIEEHDTCRDLYSLTVGQCVASVVGDTQVQVEQMVDIWYIQSTFYNNSITSYVPPSNSSKYYGDFAQILWAKSNLVGCGRSRFKTPWQGELRNVERLVCNIAPVGPKPKHRLWVPAVPAFLCPYGSSQSLTWHHLCEYPETVGELQETLLRNERVLSRKKGKRRKALHRIRRSKRDKKSRHHTESQSRETANFDPFSFRYSSGTSVAPSLVIVFALCL